MGEKFTKGPWKVDDIITTHSQLADAKRGGDFEWARPQNLPLANVWKQDGNSITGLPGNIEVGLANANLIAASPDLFSACEDGPRSFRDFPTFLRRVADHLSSKGSTEFAESLEAKANAIESALKKARGE